MNDELNMRGFPKSYQEKAAVQGAAFWAYSLEFQWGTACIELGACGQVDSPSKGISLYMENTTNQVGSHHRATDALESWKDTDTPTRKVMSAGLVIRLHQLDYSEGTGTDLNSYSRAFQVRMMMTILATRPTPVLRTNGKL